MTPFLFFVTFGVREWVDKDFNEKIQFSFSTFYYPQMLCKTEIVCE